MSVIGCVFMPINFEQTRAQRVTAKVGARAGLPLLDYCEFTNGIAGQNNPITLLGNEYNLLISSNNKSKL